MSNVTIEYSTTGQEADITVTSGSAQYALKNFVDSDLLVIGGFTADSATLSGGPTSRVIQFYNGPTLVYSLTCQGTSPSSISFQAAGGAYRITAGN